MLGFYTFAGPWVISVIKSHGQSYCYYNNNEACSRSSRSDFSTGQGKTDSYHHSKWQIIILVSRACHMQFTNRYPLFWLNQCAPKQCAGRIIFPSSLCPHSNNKSLTFHHPLQILTNVFSPFIRIPLSGVCSWVLERDYFFWWLSADFQQTFSRL